MLQTFKEKMPVNSFFCIKFQNKEDTQSLQFLFQSCLPEMTLQQNDKVTLPE